MNPTGARLRPRNDQALRILIVDDSIVVRTMFQRMVEDVPGFDVAGVASRAEQALALLAGLSVDVILLDLQMPGMDGLTALPAILVAGGGAHVVIVSSSCAEGAVATVQALAWGASDTLLKPDTGMMAGGFADRLIEKLRRLGPARSGYAAGPVPVSAGRHPAVRRDPVGCVAIGASTGGLLALAGLFEEIDSASDVPFLVTQHLPGEFLPYFADQLAEMAGRPAKVARAGQPLAPGEILIAPGAAHLSLVRDGDIVRIRHDRTAAVSACLPSVDPMLDAVGAIYAASGVGVVLSGMGRDGAIGAARLAAAGGEILAQDAATSTVWGMPGAVVRAGIATAVLPPAAIGRRITERLSASRSRTPAKDIAAWR